MQCFLILVNPLFRFVADFSANLANLTI